MDIGVAGIHRFFNKKETIEKFDVIIVIAGMEGALPSVVGGLFSQPIIAVPTSVGYGAALNGFTALMSMLTSCANGITVVNIDNGFGAAIAAFRILKSFND
jgi:NCAIR mutase (PurE)-related protein